MNQPTKKSNGEQDKSLENWLWDAACSIRGAQEAARNQPRKRWTSCWS
ncbi:hypothetical protein [Methylomonas methanica]|nr:hypothetical protein [Methylomonas methanica]